MWLTILPYLEQSAMEEMYNLDLGWQSNIALQDNRVMPVYVCPSDGKWMNYPNRRNYFGVAGGKTPSSLGWRGYVCFDGPFAMAVENRHPNRQRRLNEILDGTSLTFAVGESVHATKWGMGPGYGIANIGGPVGWLWGGACVKTPVLCADVNQSYDRDMRNTFRWGVNFDVIKTLGGIADNMQTDLPFGSYHPGGAQFLFIDGHVGFVRQTVSMRLYQAASTHAGGETLDPSNL
jgi:prepilin-type processing-associated H-X9-DG protein